MPSSRGPSLLRRVLGKSSSSQKDSHSRSRHEIGSFAPASYERGLSFCENLRVVVEAKDDTVFGIWLDASGEESDHFTFRDTYDRAGAIAHQLRHDWGCERGERVLLCYVPGFEFYTAFIGCLRAGVVAVPVYPPNPKQPGPGIEKLALVQQVRLRWRRVFSFLLHSSHPNNIVFLLLNLGLRCPTVSARHQGRPSQNHHISVCLAQTLDI